MLLEGDALPHFHRRGAMIQACEQKFHGARTGLNPMCAAHVSAEHPSTVRAISAAFRPRQPAEARSTIMSRHSAQVKKERRIFGSDNQRVPDSVDAQVIAKTTPSVSSTNPRFIEVLIMLSSVASGGSFSSHALDCLF